MQKFYIYLCLSFAAYLISCRPSGNGLYSTSSTFEHSKEFIQPQDLPNFRFGFSPTLPDGMPREAWDNIYDKFTSSPRVLRYGEMMSKIRKAKNWREADVLGRQLIQDYEREEVLFFVQQQVASGMLRSYFIHEESTFETRQVMGYYMDMLVRNKYFSDPCLFAQVLPKLQEYWSNQKIADIAQKTLPYGTRIYAEWKGQPFTLENYFLAKVKAANKLTADDNTLRAEAQQQKKAFQQNIQLEALKLKSLYEREDKFVGFSITFEDTAILAILAGQNSVDNQK